MLPFTARLLFSSQIDMPHLAFNAAPSASSSMPQLQPAIVLHVAPGKYTVVKMIVSNLISQQMFVLHHQALFLNLRIA